MCAAVICNAVEVTGLIEYHSRTRLYSILLTGETMQHGFRPVAIRLATQSKYRAAPTAVIVGRGCAVEVSSCVENQACDRVKSAGAPGVKGIQYLLFPASASIRQQFEDCASAIKSPVEGGAVQVSGGIENYSGGSSPGGVIEWGEHDLFLGDCGGRYCKHGYEEKNGVDGEHLEAGFGHADTPGVWSNGH